MNKAERTLAQGILVPSLTVFHEDARESVDEARTAAHINWLIEQGADAIIPAGSSGEFPALSLEESIRLFQIAIETSAGRVPVYPAVGRYSTYATTELAYAAKSAGANGVMVLPPYYMKPSQEEILEHYRAVARAVKLPIIAYNNPVTTEVEISHETIIQLANEGVIHGVKTSQGMEPAIRLSTHPKLSSYYGHDLEPWSALTNGAHGWFSLLPNAIPKLAKKLLMSEGRQARQEAWRSIEPIAKFVWQGGFAHPLATVKAALKLQGREVGVPRLPLQPLSADGMKTLEGILQRGGVLGVTNEGEKCVRHLSRSGCAIMSG